jgi:flagella basal body P-ring formation protein FlgA
MMSLTNLTKIHSLAICLLAFVGFSLAKAGTFSNAIVLRENCNLLENKIKALLKKEIKQHYSEIALSLEPTSIVRQLSQMLEQVRSISLQQVDLDQKSFGVRIETVEGHNISLSGTYKCSKNFPVLNKNIQVGQIIREKDLKVQSISINLLNEFSSNILEKTVQIIGMEAKVNMKANNFVYSDQLKNPAVIKAQETIDILFDGNGFSLSTKGKALQSGAIGDVIRVQNLKSKKIVSGVISDPKTVTIKVR